MIQDHIKLGWLYQYLEGFNWLQQFEWHAYTDADVSDSAIVGDNIDTDLEYDILLHIPSYTRPASELRRILLAWLNAANPDPHQRLSIEYQHLDKNTANVLVTMTVQEIQVQEVCNNEEEAEGWWLMGGELQPVRLDRSQPDELLTLAGISRIKDR